MDEIVLFERVLWGIGLFLDGVLLALLLGRKNHRVFPAFFVYILADFVQGFVVSVSYRTWGFTSPTASRVAWGTQAIVIAARALAVAQICERVLAKYKGVWALTKRLLLATATVVLLLSWGIAKGSWQFAVLNADRGMELAIASSILVLFLFIRYYGVAVKHSVRAMAIGFFLYSCFHVLNDTILERWMHNYSTSWNLVGTLSMLASQSLWIWVLRERQSVATLEPGLLPEEVYYAVTPEINDRLRKLNDHLGQFWNMVGKRS
ncbi:MAG TPA: hypothetical protein VJO16_01610 [Candidatus Acidoferrum sp.]|nr:hypothetical protein [Candidatus Acidoferrum sp.]